MVIVGGTAAAIGRISVGHFFDKFSFIIMMYFCVGGALFFSLLFFIFGKSYLTIIVFMFLINLCGKILIYRGRNNAYYGSLIK